MGLFRTVFLGRENGIRRSAMKQVFGGRGADQSTAKVAHSEDAQVAVGEQSLALSIEAPKDVTPPKGFEVVLHKDALPEGEMVEIIIGGKAIAVAKFSGAFYALENACPNGNGPLVDGELNGPIVKCPYDGLEFDIRDGTCLSSSESTVGTFKVEVVADAVCVAV